jgi:hypothetical protein
LFIVPSIIDFVVYELTPGIVAEFIASPLKAGIGRDSDGLP